MLFAAFLSWRWNKLDEKDWEEIRDALIKKVVKIKLKEMGFENFRNLIINDKKAQRKAVNFILLKKLAESFIQHETSVEKLWNEFMEFVNIFPRALSLE